MAILVFVSANLDVNPMFYGSSAVVLHPKNCKGSSVALALSEYPIKPRLLVEPN